MTTTDAPPAEPPLTTRLVRYPHDGMFAGVCEAFGRYTRTDPVIWRVLVAVLTFFGGTGALLYLLGWLLIPVAGESRSVAERLLHRHARFPGHRASWLIFGLVIAVVAISANHAVLWPLAVLGGVAYLVYRERSGHHGVTVPPVATVPGATREGTPDGATALSEGVSPPTEVRPPPPPRRRRPRRPRSPLGRITLSVAALVAGIMLLVGGDGGNVTPARVLAAVLVVVGVGLIVGTWYGRSRLLVVAGLALTAALAPVAVAQSLPDGGSGHRLWAPVEGGQTYQLTAGDATVDLTGVPVGQTGPIAVRVGLGHVLVTLPPARSVLVHAHVGVGAIDLDGDQRSGVDINRDFTVGPDGSPPLVLTVRLSAGQIEVHRG